MIATVGPARVEAFRHILTRRLGLTLEGTATADLAGILADRASAHGQPEADYLARLAAGGRPDEIGVLAAALTVSETYFFRNCEQFRALADVVLPMRMQARAGERRIRLLSAGCASGEEAYTMAMVVRDVVTDPSWTVSILGVDVNPAMVDRATRGRFSEWSLRATPARTRARWFHTDGGSAVVDEELRRLVHFVTGNLADSDPAWLSPAEYDVVFCRNTLMYLTPEHRDRALSRLTAALAPGGFLFVGHAESTFGRDAGLELRHSHDAFYFQRSTAPVGRVWIDAIAASAGCIASVRASAPPPARAAPTPTVAPAGAPIARSSRDQALQLLRQERFDEASALLDNHPANPVDDPDIAILRGVLLAHRGRLDQAEALCRRLLEADGLNPETHHLLALCRDGRGNELDAVRHDQIAAHLDPGFAIPRLRLGLLAKRRGDRAVARHEIGAALTLLPGEDPRRLLLFGGGFTRAGLIDLCRRHFVGCGGPE
jgi:chemotaxis protein methyltransferase CheR